MGAFIGLWFAQIVLGVVIGVTNPKQPSVGEKTERVRKLAVYGGLVPCIGIMFICQLVWFAVYRAMLGREQSRRRDAQGGISYEGFEEQPPSLHPQTGTSAPSDNPFDEDD